MRIEPAYKYTVDCLECSCPGPWALSENEAEALARREGWQRVPGSLGAWICPDCAPDHIMRMWDENLARDYGDYGIQRRAE